MESSEPELPPGFSCKLIREVAAAEASPTAVLRLRKPKVLPCVFDYLRVKLLLINVCATAQSTSSSSQEESLKKQRKSQEMLVANDIAGQKRKNKTIKLENQEEDNMETMNAELPEVEDTIKEQLTSKSDKNKPKTADKTASSPTLKIGKRAPKKVSDIPSTRQKKGVCCDLLSTLSEKELEDNIQDVILISCHEKLVKQSAEATRVVSDIEVDLIKAKKYLAPLEARVQDTRELLDKLEVELRERKTDLANLEAEKAQQMEAMAAVDVKIQAIELEAAEARSSLRDILSR
ncbi:hypothetical protein JCGZ_20125 [Jatropha curcas]|uniref:Uncharacterized protein n=1 Tax=Jatropha curcas TaxID=180498 RepID=A0A067K6L9_JATCU|nr:hypothetical protein JCGZ_20125 [Jatropha curcas]